MTVSTEVDHNEYTGNGVTTSFPYTFRIFKKSDLVVQVSDLNGNVTELVLDTGYTVTGAGTYSGGSVVLPSPLATGWRITIDRVLDVVQETDLRNQGKFFPEVHEDAFDYLTMLIQQCFGWFRRALMKPSLLAKYYDAKQNRISNLADPSLEQDAVNNRSMRNYVDAAIAGVVGGFGWFIQYGSGAVYRTFQDKMRDVYNVKDFGAKGDNIIDDTPAFIAAANALGEGGKLYVPKGIYNVTGPVNIPPINICGDGQGETVIVFDNTTSPKDGFVFAAPTKYDIEFGLSHLTVKTKGGNGDNAIYTPRGVGLNHLRPKPTFIFLSFCSEPANVEYDEFAQKYGWRWAFNCGDSWQFTIERIDAVGCYQIAKSYNEQFLDGFIRTAPEEGILSMRVSDITTHNVANFFEIKQKTYFTLLNIDAAKALRGIYDADDRIFETNRYAYGECICTNVGINAQLEPVRLDNRFLLIMNGMFIHRAAKGYDHGLEWVGLKLSRARVCSFQGIEIGTARGYSGTKKGIVLDAGDANNFTNVTFGLLDVCAQIGDSNSQYGANFATCFNNVSINADTVLLFDLQLCRNFHCDGYGASSAYTLQQFHRNSDDTSNTYTFSNVGKHNLYTDNSLYLHNSASLENGKNIRIDTRNGLSVSTQTDTGSAGNNFLIIRRTGVDIDSFELRTRSTAGAYTYINTPETHFSGLIKPTVDNVNSNGTSAFRWSQVYAGTGSINTSNEELKLRIEADEKTTESERLAALEIKENIWRFKFKDAVKIKSDGARIHFGVGAQTVGNILRKYGLDPNNYAFWCYDEWDDIYAPEVLIRSVKNNETGEWYDEEYYTGRQIIIKPAGYQYGIRYEELLIFILMFI